MEIVLTDSIELHVDASLLCEFTLENPLKNGIKFAGVDASLNQRWMEFRTTLNELAADNNLERLRPGPEQPVIILDDSEFEDATDDIEKFWIAARSEIREADSLVARTWLESELAGDMVSLISHLAVFNSKSSKEIRLWDQMLEFKPVGLSADQKQALIVLDVVLRNSFGGQLKNLPKTNGYAKYVLDNFETFKPIVDERVLTSKFVSFAKLYKDWLTEPSSREDAEATLIESGPFSFPPVPIAEHMIDIASENSTPQDLRKLTKLVMLNLRDRDDVSWARQLAQGSKPI